MFSMVAVIPLVTSADRKVTDRIDRWTVNSVGNFRGSGWL
jgi:hypothetical protein